MANIQKIKLENRHQSKVKNNAKIKTQIIAPVAALHIHKISKTKKKSKKKSKKKKKTQLFAPKVLVQQEDGSVLFSTATSAALFPAGETPGGLQKTEAGQFHGVEGEQFGAVVGEEVWSDCVELTPGSFSV